MLTRSVSARRSDRAITTLANCHDRTSIMRTLSNLAGDRRLLVGIELSPFSPGDDRGPVPPTGLRFVLRVSEEERGVLEVELNSNLKPVIEEASVLFASVASSCEEALLRIAADVSHPELAVAQ